MNSGLLRNEHKHNKNARKSHVNSFQIDPRFNFFNLNFLTDFNYILKKLNCELLF